MRKLALILPLFLLMACAENSGFRAPSLSGDPTGMSADTLCYRAAYAKENPALHAEIRARNLDCTSILATQPQAGESRF